MNEKRILGKYSQNKKGPLLLVTSAVHGNEPSGVNALKNIFKVLQKQQPKINGTFIGLIGNQNALDKKARFIDEDLNRTWKTANIENPDKNSNEQQEMTEIIALLKELQQEDYTATYFIDCHTTSSSSLPYMSVQEVGNNDKWAHQFPIHIIRGFSDIVSGTIDGYLSHQGFTGFTLEAGQHDNKNSEQYHEGCIWIALREACGLDFSELPDIPDSVLKTMNNTPPQKTFKIIYRFGLKETDTFEMEPGFENFQSIKNGELIATLNNQKIHSNWNAYIFMPLYQSQGNDGFFVVEEVKN